MAADKAVTAAVWAKAKRLYGDPDVKLGTIAELVGMAPIQLSLAAKARGWPPRKRAPRSAGAGADAATAAVKSPKGASSQDRERASRALSQMVSSLEKAVEMQREMTKTTAKGSAAKDKKALAHAEDLRRAIAERLERLQRQRALGKRSE